MIRLALFFSFVTLLAAEPPEFEPNWGQSPTEHSYLARFAGERAYISPDRLMLRGRGDAILSFAPLPGLQI